MGLKKHRLKTLRSLYVDVFNKTTVGILLVDKDGIIKDSNETFRKIFGFELKSELRDQHIEICQIDETLKKDFQVLSDYILAGNNIVEKEFPLRAKNGDKIWCELSGTLLTKDDRMKEGGILWDVVNITEKRKTKKLLKKQHQELKELNKVLNNKVEFGVEKLRKQDKLLTQHTKMAMMGEMLDAIAHQWKQPLSVIKLSADEMHHYSQEEQIDYEYLDEVSLRVQSQVDHLVETIDEFRDFFRPKDTLESKNIKDTLDSSIRILKDELIKNTITIEFSGDMNVTAKFIPNEFKHIIINLILNAKDQFIQNDTKNRLIHFELESNKKYATVTVSDNGGGIPKEYLDKIFEANFTTKTQVHGTGIGLYMTKNILEKIGAKIKAKNSEAGAQFIIRIPI